MPRSSARLLQVRLGQRLQSLRRERGLTQEAVAARSGISQKYLSELERGGKMPSWETLVSLAHAGFEIKLSALLFGIDEDQIEGVHRLEELLAGRPEQVRYDVLQAVGILLHAGETQRVKKKPR